MLFLFPRFPASPPASRRDGPVEDCSRQMPEAVGHPQQRKVFLLVDYEGGRAKRADPAMRLEWTDASRRVRARLGGTPPDARGVPPRLWYRDGMSLDETHFPSLG